MMREPFNLLRPSLRRPAQLWTLVALFATLAGFGSWQAWQLARETEIAHASLKHLQSKRRPPAAPKPNKADMEMARRWEALAAERAFNWYPVFRALEQTASEDIELLEFLPDKMGGHLVLRGEARSDTALVQYLDALAKEGTMAEVYLAHQKTAQRGTLTVVAFEVRMNISSRIRK